MPAARVPVSWHFESVVVDSGTHRVVVNGAQQPLEPKSFKLLQFLIENRDRVVSKQEIFDAVWAGAFVTDNALTRAIAQIRKALGDDSKDSRFIETIPTVGYRFVATVQEVPHEQARLAAPETPAAPAPPEAPIATPPTALRAPRTSGRSLGVAAIVALAAVALGIWLFRPASLPVSPQPEALKPVQFSSSPGLDGIMPASGGPIEVILKSDQPTYASGWMADNDRILFAGFRDGVWNLYTVSRTTKQVERLTSYNSMRTYIRYPDWMVGDHVVYEFNETKGNIFVADLKR